jgi:hypothetical protein
MAISRQLSAISRQVGAARRAGCPDGEMRGHAHHGGDDDAHRPEQEEER